MKRRRFLKTAGATALAAGAGPTIIIPGRAQPQTLKILFPRRSFAGFDPWLSDYYVRAWGEENDTRVILNWGSWKDVVKQHKEEVRAQQGHDLIHLAVLGNMFAHAASGKMPPEEALAHNTPRREKSYETAKFSQTGRRNSAGPAVIVPGRAQPKMLRIARLVEKSQ